MVMSCLPLFSDGISWPDPDKLRAADYLYIRRPRFASKELIRLLQDVRKTNPDILVLYEIPTYPYDGEMSGVKMSFALRKDRKYRQELPALVDRAVILVDEDRALGMPTVRITNGVDLGAIATRKPSARAGRIDILCVAYFEPWHGADRLLEGLAGYYKSTQDPREVHVHLAGGGSQLPSLKRIAESRGLSEHVTFYGPLSPDELDPLYDRCGLAVECLGMYRKGLGHAVSASLKSREYLAKGIPFIYAGKIDLFQQNPVDFCLQIPDDPSPVDIPQVIAFYDSLHDRESDAELIRRIRSYAEEHVSMDAAMRNVVALIEERCS
jgi:glycosyltransferase involved in cell wall biosynthesis